MRSRYVAIRELIYGPLHHESASHRIVSHRCYFRALTNAIRFSWLAEETDPGGAASLFSRRGRRRAVGEGGGVANQWPFCLANRRDIRSTMRDIQAVCSGNTLFPFFGVLPAYGNAVIT